jgi:hypothetical protein
MTASILSVIILTEGNEIETYIYIEMNALYELDMNNSNNNHLNILDLPNEILLIILKKLNMVDVLYSLVDVNQRFDRLALDFLYVRDFDMTTDIMINNSLYNQTSIETRFLSKICQQILPRIHHQVHKLTVEECSMKAILLAANYPQLYSLSLIHFEEEILHQCLTGMIFNCVCYNYNKNNRSS